jgi:hypothetical protein
MDYSKALFVPENRDIIENLRVGQIFSFDGITFSLNIGGETIFSVSDYMIYLGENTNPHSTLNSILFLVVLKNGRTIIWSQSRGNIERLLDSGRMTKSNRKVIPNQLLQEIQNYLPERQTKEKENVQIVGSEVNFGKRDVTPMNLPPEIKNNLLRFLGRYPDDENQFPNDFINEYSKKDKDDEDDNQKAGRKSRKSRKTKRSRKTRKTKRTHKSKKYRKSKR